MAEKDKEKKDAGEDMVQVPQSVLEKLQERMAELERRDVEREGLIAGLQEMVEKGADTVGEKKLKSKKSFEPKFRTVRLRKYPIGGDDNNAGYVIGWTAKGAFQEVDRSGVSPQVVDMIEVIFLGQEKKAEKVRLLDLMNRGIQTHCKILEVKKETKEVATGEEIDVTVWDPQHGLVATGDKVDGMTTYHKIEYLLEIPGIKEPTWVNAMYLN